MIVLGLDTSNYTTSIACYGETCKNVSKLLPVKDGQLGLRQSDALFWHVRQLPEVCHTLSETVSLQTASAIGVSTRPRAVEGSYMPCFLAGEGFASVLSDTLKKPLYRFSHQQGHIAASLWSAGRMDLLDKPHLAWHLSGGTTELLLVEPEGRSVHATRIGGTSDISAGQLIDRSGKLLGISFPAGKAVDALSRECEDPDFFQVKLRGLEVSFSGLENKVSDQLSAGKSAAQIARYALLSVIHAVLSVTEAACKEYPGLCVVFSGGVASNSLLRERAASFSPVFAAPEFSTDNAMGIAVLASRMEA